MESDFWYFNSFGPAPSVMKRRRTALPDPGPGQAAVAIRAVGLNQAENRYLQGTHFPPQRFPACIGHEAVGEIVALGPEGNTTRRWAVGDRVALAPMLVDIAGMGALRTLGIYDQSALVPVPPGYSDAEGAAYWMGLFTMAGAMEQAGLGEDSCRGRTVLFTAAAGGMGILGLKIARAWGATTIATTRSEAKAEKLAPLASHAIVVRTPEELHAAVAALAPGGVDAAIDPLGGPFVGAALATLAHGGRYVGYEMIAGRRAEYDIASLLSKDASIRGHTIHQLIEKPALTKRLVEIGMVYADALTPIVAQTIGFDRAPEAFEALQRSSSIGKIVVSL